jgi:uncharacterized damage-inducible protein DinB
VTGSAEAERIADQVDCAYTDGAWVGVSIRDLFRDLSAGEAAARPVAAAHSAWEIARHLAFWHDAVRRRLEGEAVDYEQDEDWPLPGESTEANWQAALDQLDRSHQALVARIRSIEPRSLDAPVAGRPFTVSSMLRGVPQHNFYHGGQVVLLIKAVRRT